MLINGFRYNAVEANIRKPGRPDLGLIVSDTPARVAAVFTTNRVKAAPLLLDMERLASRGAARAILINSGVANACTGASGMVAARECSRLAAARLNIDEELVQLASTGVIGEPLPVERFAAAMESLVAGLSPEGYDRVARAMMTTDTISKTASRTVTIDNQPVRLFGLAKGSGMIMPNMATMLCFVVTDVAAASDVLQGLLRQGVDSSFNRITVDGDTSTNDMVLLLANGAAGNREIAAADAPEAEILGRGLAELLLELALLIVKDGEGATKLVTVRVSGARDDREAEQAARTIANSPLVKTAFFGQDANWGRIIAALGRAGVEFDPQRVDIAFNGVTMVRDSLGQGKEAERQATEVLRQPSFTVHVDMNSGPGQAEVYTCDFSLDYVKINADYRS